MSTSKELIISSTGFPGTNKTLRHIQEAFGEPLGALAELVGSPAIVSGIVALDNGISYSNGFIAYNGRIIPFKGGGFHEKISLINEIETAQYDSFNENGELQSLPAYKTEYFLFGENPKATEILEFSSLKRIMSLEKIIEIITNLPKPDWLVTLKNDPSYIKNKPFNNIKFTKGTGTTFNRTHIGYYYNDNTKNCYHIYPPTGFSTYHLAGFIPSIAEISFTGVVNEDDTLWCKYDVQHNYGSNGRVVVYCNNSENRYPSKINYLAIWMK